MASLNGIGFKKFLGVTLFFCVYFFIPLPHCSDPAIMESVKKECQNFGSNDPYMSGGFPSEEECVAYKYGEEMGKNGKGFEECSEFKDQTYLQMDCNKGLSSTHIHTESSFNYFTPMLIVSILVVLWGIFFR